MQICHCTFNYFEINVLQDSKITEFVNDYFVENVCIDVHNLTFFFFCFILLFFRFIKANFFENVILFSRGIRFGLFSQIYVLLNSLVNASSIVLTKCDYRIQFHSKNRYQSRNSLRCTLCIVTFFKKITSYFIYVKSNFSSILSFCQFMAQLSNEKKKNR